MNQPKNILIVRTDRIGDVVLSLPLIDIIKQSYPKCEISFLVRNYTADLVENYIGVDEVLILKEKSGKAELISNLRLLRNKKYENAIIVYPTFIISLIVFLSGIKNRIGSGYRWYSFFFNKKVYEHRKTAEKHELEYNISMLKQIGIEFNYKDLKPNYNFNLPDTLRNRTDDLYKELGFSTNKLTIIVHPGSGGSAVDLPLLKMRELVKKISNLDCNILITGSKSESDLCEEFQINDNIKSVAGRLNLSELITLISFSNIFIGNSTGPLHIASALGKYVIGFYPKILACSPNRWGPYTENKLVFVPEIDCVNCTREQCTKLNCMDSINIDSVFANIQKIYKLLINNGDFNE